MRNILTVVGARPQFVKAAVVSKALAEQGIKEQIIHTGQHYDRNMSTVFWEELEIPAPNINLNIGSGNHGSQTGIMMKEIEQFILAMDNYPDALLVYGDTNSTLAGALVASKINIPVIHVEAGLRSFNKEMPEEINRILTDHASNLLFCSSNTGVKQLKKEGIQEGIFDVGDVMYDAVLAFSEIANQKIRLSEITNLKSREFCLATVHRPVNTNNPDNLSAIIQAFFELKSKILWPVHPRNKAKLEGLTIPENLTLIEPVSYFEMLVLLRNCSKVFTDSGGLQKEAYWMQKQCITLRNETEWIETLEGGWNSLTGAKKDKILKANTVKPSKEWAPLYGTGDASKKIARVISEFET